MQQTLKDHVYHLLAEARRELEEANAAAEMAWGPTELGKAKPQALQLADRIAVGEAMLQEPNHDPIVPKALRTLQAMYRRALADPADRKRCEAYEAAYARYKAAEAVYLGRVHEAREIYGLSEEEIREAEATSLEEAAA